MIKTHTGRTVEGEELQAAREHVASWYDEYAAEIRAGKSSYASHVTPEMIEDDAKNKENSATEIRNGKSDNCFAIWQRMNQFITGECVAYFEQPRKTKSFAEIDMTYCEDCSSYDCGCPEKKAHAVHIAELEAKIAEQQSLIRVLVALAASEAFDCPLGTIGHFGVTEDLVKDNCYCQGTDWSESCPQGDDCWKELLPLIAKDQIKEG